MINYIFLGLFFLSVISTAQKNEKMLLSGNISIDSKLLFNESVSNTTSLIPAQAPKKSVLLAGVLSFILPGAGEFYTENYYQAAAFAAIELTAIGIAVTYDKKGNDQTTVFQNFADQNWSVVKYAEWLNRFEQANIPINPDVTLNPWYRVNWDSLNYYESKFSHKLPRHGEQQYYELIGKYPQYSPGWNAFDPNEPDYHVLPQIFLDYAAMRGKANDYYNIASKAVIAIYINHFLSVIDAVWSAVNYNKNISISAEYEKISLQGFADYETKLNFRIRF